MFNRKWTYRFHTRRIYWFVTKEIRKYTDKKIIVRQKPNRDERTKKGQNLKDQLKKDILEISKKYDRELKGKVNVKDWVVHRELDIIIDRAYSSAWDALEAHNAEQGYTSQGRELKMLRHQMRQGDVSGSSETQKRLKKLHQMAK